MKHRIVALSVTAFLLAFAQMQANAAEGKLAETAAAPDANRTSSYSRGAASAATQKASGDQASPAPRVHTGKSMPAKKTRAVTTMAARSTDFFISSTESTLRSDRDGDSYHAEFRVRFDADVIFGDATVYAKLYLRRAGENEWYLYHETDDFLINGESSSDEYFVVTTLDGGYPTGEYDVLIDLYESGYSGIVATIGPLDSPALSYLPLEEIDLDVPIAIDGYSIGDVTTELIRDTDGDGHYSRFRITFDPDTDFDSRRLVYARLYVRPRGGEWIEEYVSENFWADPSGPSDVYALSADWTGGYPTSFYDVQIDLYDVGTNLLAAAAGSERSALGQIPLEDQSRDQFVNRPPPGSGGGGSSSSEEGGGGALGWAPVLGLLALGLARIRRRYQRT